MLAFLIGGLRGARDRPQPVPGLLGHLQGRRPELARSPDGHRRRATPPPYNFSQTLLQTTTLILTRPRRRVRLPLRDVQHRRQRPVPRRPRSSRTGSASRSSHMARPAHILLAVARRGCAGAIWAGIAGFLKATVGAHEVITTIMLNWIAFWVGSLPLPAGRPAPGRGEQAARHPDLRRRRPRARSCRSSGATPTSRACTSASSSRSATLVVFWLILNRTTLGYEVPRGRLQPGRGAYGGISVRTNYCPRDGDLGRVRRPRRRARHARLPLPLRHH